MRIKTIWVILEELLVKPARAVYDCHKWMKKQKFELAKLCKKIYKNSKSMEEALRLNVRFPEPRPVLPLLPYKDSK